MTPPNWEPALVRSAARVVPCVCAVMCGVWAGWATTILLLASSPVSFEKAAFGALAGYAGGWMLVRVWRSSLNWRITGRSSWMYGMLGCLSLLLATEALVRTRRAQFAIDNAVQARLRNGPPAALRGYQVVRSLMRRPPPSSPRLLVCGSSQMNAAILDNELRAGLPEFAVEKWTLPGMGCLRMLMVNPAMKPVAGDTVLVYWSEFDIGMSDGADAAWFRPIANREGIRDILRHLPTQRILKDWKGVLDLGLAGTSELWRMRDGWRLLINRGLGMAPQPSATLAETINFQRKAYVQGLADDGTVSAGLAAASTLVAGWSARGARVIVLEGSVNPVLHHAETDRRRKHVRSVLREICRSGNARYIAASDQPFQPRGGDWSDGTHLNRAGADEFTRQVIAEVRMVSP